MQLQQIELIIIRRKVLMNMDMEGQLAKQEACLTNSIVLVSRIDSRLWDFHCHPQLVVILHICK